MDICKNIIKCTSMIDLFEKQQSGDIETLVVTIQNDNVIEQYINKTSCNPNSVKCVLDTLHKLFVSIVLVWPVILMLVFAIIKKDIKYITSNIFQLLPISQYIIGLIYYKSDHYYICLKRNVDNIKHIVISYIVSVIISLGIFVSIIILMACKSNLSIFRELTNYTNIIGFIFVIIFTGLHSFYSYLVILINLVTFGSIFIVHSLEISKYYNTLEKFIGENLDQLSLESITKEHAETKSYHSLSVKKFNSLFSSITIIGFVGAYYVILYYKSDFSSIYNYMFLATFIVIELLYVFSINKVKNAVSNISKLMSSEKIISRYLSIVQFKDLSDDDNNDVSIQLRHLIEISNRTAIRVSENMRRLEWHTLHKKLSEEWDCFNICGFDIDDATILNKIITIIVGMFMLLNIKNLFGL